MTNDSEPNLGGDLFELFSLLEKRNLRYLLVGGVALLKYVEGRNTEDIDLVLSARSLKRLPELVITEQDSDFARGTFRNIRVDVLLTSNPVFKLVNEKYATTHTFDETEVRIATPDGLILLKLYALPSLYRQGDGQRIALYESDMMMLMLRHRPDTTPLLEALRPHVDEGQFHELNRIVADIQTRITRIDEAQRDEN